jgi:hypothetical protein
MIHDDECGTFGGMRMEKTCSSATSSTINYTLSHVGPNPDLSSGKPATNRLSYGAAHSVTNFTVVMDGFAEVIPVFQRLF